MWRETTYVCEHGVEYVALTAGAVVTSAGAKALFECNCEEDDR